MCQFLLLFNLVCKENKHTIIYNNSLETTFPFLYIYVCRFNLKAVISILIYRMALLIHEHIGENIHR